MLKLTFRCNDTYTIEVYEIFAIRTIANRPFVETKKSCFLRDYFGGGSLG